MNIAVLASGNGSNFEAIVKAVKKRQIKARLKLLITDKNNAFVRTRARRNKIKDVFIDPSKFKSRIAYDKKIAKLLKNEKIDLIVLAGFMRILSEQFVKKFRNKIINIHPALLPAFKGEGAIERAFKHGCKITGVTVHFVDEKVDNGPIILQEAVKIKNNMNLTTLEKEIHKVEHKLYPQAIKLAIDKKLKNYGRTVKTISQK